MFTACGSRFSETESGLQYKFHTKSKEDPAGVGSILRLDMTYGLQDSVIFDSRMSPVPMYLELLDPEYPGDIYEGLAMMSPGDSATFVLDAVDFFLNTAGMAHIPDIIVPGDLLYFNIRLHKSMDEDGFMEDQQEMAEKQLQEMERQEMEEDGILRQYVLDENITVEPRESGLYYIEVEAGDGDRVTPGSTVSVHYEGRLLDGTVFDSSYERGEPFQFQVGLGRVIPGWDEGLTQMHVGGKARLIIPSHIGYGDRGAGDLIPPFSTLVFDVEVLEVTEQP